MSRMSPRAVLVSLLAAFSVLACSAGEAGRPDNDKDPGKSARVDGEVLLSRAPGEEMDPVARKGPT